MVVVGLPYRIYVGPGQSEVEDVVRHREGTFVRTTQAMNSGARATDIIHHTQAKDKRLNF